MATFHIHIKGQVQGVGFRPYVFKLAKEAGLKGWVNNMVDGVHVVFNASPAEASLFYQKIINQAPELSIITDHQMEETGDSTFSGFDIVHSDSSGRPDLLLTPDFAMCEDCRRELLNQKDRRAGYPFITCTNCGPRFSIVTGLPYDRERTTMEVFSMCEDCQAEYDDPMDRRYYSQTNSCEECGVSLALYLPGSQKVEEISGNQAIALTAMEIMNGKVAAVKGIGGYLLVCDATNSGAVRRLRQRKQRPAKPFALMYPDLQTLSVDAHLVSQEERMLKSPQAPILLLNTKPEAPSGVDLESIAPGLDQLGVMLPYTPLYDLLLREVGRPVVATSGNVSGAPIVFKDDQALTDLFRIADIILVNNRHIAIPQDDSVIRYTTFTKTKIIVRRSRGMAPTHLQPEINFPGETILAMGAFLKSSFALLHQKNVYISQYLGKLEYFDTQENYKHTLNHFLQLFSTEPFVVLADQHPAYFSTQYGEELARKWNVPVIKIQHHEAHFAAVIAENNLLHEENVLGVVWDGTGMGNDGQIWGGEFFMYKHQQITRVSHFDYFPSILGDKMAREPRISALSVCSGLTAPQVLRAVFSDLEWENYHRLIDRTKLYTSSLGRIFDAVACLLGMIDVMTYEGQAAMMIEKLGRRYFEKNGFSITESFLNEEDFHGNVPTELLFSRILRDIEDGVSAEVIAAKFHYSLVQIVRFVARKQEVRKIAFSGGVLQNGLLVDIFVWELGRDFELYFHKKLSPNDECISYGQLIRYLLSSGSFKARAND